MKRMYISYFALILFAVCDITLNSNGGEIDFVNIDINRTVDYSVSDDTLSFQILIVEDDLLRSVFEAILTLDQASECYIPNAVYGVNVRKNSDSIIITVGIRGVVAYTSDDEIGVISIKDRLFYVYGNSGAEELFSLSGRRARISEIRDYRDRSTLGYLYDKIMPYYVIIYADAQPRVMSWQQCMTIDDLRERHSPDR